MDLSALKKNLEKRHFKVSLFPNKEEAAAYLADNIKGETVGFGGSMTLKDMGLYELLGKENKVLWHNRVPDDKFRFAEFTAYVTSVNGVAETGEMVNIDGSGNRVSASTFGPGKVYFVFGRNKVMPDLASAIDRARNIASPLNCRRLEKKTPCVTDLRCHDCTSPERLCGVMAIHMSPLHGAKLSEVIIIDEDLGY